MRLSPIPIRPQVVDAHTILAVWAPLLVLDQKVANAFVLSKKRFGNEATGMSGVVNRRVTEVGLCLWVNRQTGAPTLWPVPYHQPVRLDA